MTLYPDEIQKILTEKAEAIQKSNTECVSIILDMIEVLPEGTEGYKENTKFLLEMIDGYNKLTFDARIVGWRH